MSTPLITQITLDQLDGDRLYTGDGRQVTGVFSADVSLVGAAVRFVLSMRTGAGWQHLLTLTRAEGGIQVTAESAEELAIAFLLPGSLTENLSVSGLGREAQFDVEVRPVDQQPITVQGRFQIVPSTPTASTGPVARSTMDLHLEDANPHPQYVTPEELPGLIGGAGAIAYNAPAGASISALRVVCVVGGQFVYADASNPAHGSLPLWFVSAAADLGAIATGSNAGVFTDPSWGWLDAEPIWLGPNGLLTQIPPLNGAFLRVVAEPINLVTLSFRPGEARYL